MLLQTLFNNHCCDFVKLKEQEDKAIAKILEIGHSMLQTRTEYDKLMNKCNDGTLLLHFYDVNLQDKIHKYKGITLSYVYDDDDATVSGIRIVIRAPHPLLQK